MAIEIDPKKVILDNFREGETLRSVSESLHKLGYKHMLRDFKGLLRDLHLALDMKREEFFERYKVDEKLRSDFSKIEYDHFVGYLGEIAVLAVLGRDWHLVYDANALDQYQIPDGEVDGCKYDVKTKHKDMDGLSVPEAKIIYDYYILCHYRGGFVHIAGYASKEQLLRGRKFHYKNGTTARTPYELQSFDEFLRLFKR